MNTMNTTAIFSVNRIALNQTLTRLGDTIPKRASKQVLTHCRIDVNGSVIFTGHNRNLEHSTVEVIDDDDSRRGEKSATVEFDAMRKVVRKLRGELVTFELGEELRIGSTCLPSSDPDEFPMPSSPDGLIATCHGESSELVRMLDDTAYCCDCESSRYALGGVLIDLADDFTLVGTDGRRLAMSFSKLVHMSVDCERYDGQSIIVPYDACKAFLRALKHRKGQFSLQAFENYVQLSVGGTTITARRLDGRFPHWRDAIPTSETSIVFDTDELLAKVEVVSTLCTDLNRGINIELRSTETRLSSPDSRSSVEFIEPTSVGAWFQAEATAVGDLPSRNSLNDRKELGLFDSIRGDDGQLSRYGSNVDNVDVTSDCLPADWTPQMGIVAYPTILVTLDNRFLAEYLKSLKKGSQVVLRITNGASACRFEQVNSACVHVLMPLSRN